MVAPFVISATPTDSTHVTVTFDQTLSADNVLRDPLSYSFDGGLLATAVEVPTTTTVRLTTTVQVSGRRYAVTVSSGVQSALGEYLRPSQSSSVFTGASSSGASVVTALEARTHPAGGKIELFWTNPSGSPANCKIIRRERSWVFDESDAGTVVYSGSCPDPTNATPLVPKYVDTGLLDLTFYYYVVFVGVGSPYASGPESRVVGFSGAQGFDSETWIRQKGLLPRRAQWLDDRQPQAGELSKYVRLLSGWLRTMWSYQQVAGETRDAERVHYDFLLYLVQEMGWEPEGEQYDFATPRRMALMLPSIRKILGTTEGVEDAVRMLAWWSGIAQEFGVDIHTRVFGTWVEGSTLESGTISSSGAGTLTARPTTSVVSATWAVNQWSNSRLLDGMGNWLDVATSTSTVLTLPFPLEGPWRTALTNGPYLAGVYEVTVASVSGLMEGQRVQLWNRALDSADVVEITQIDASTKTLHFWNATQYAHNVTDSVLTWDVSQPQAAMFGTTLGGATAGTLVPDYTGTLHWQVNQWVGFVVRDSAGTEYTVTANTADELTLNPVAVVPSGTWRIAPVGGSSTPAARYTLYAGEWSFLFHPLFDFELTGTRLDPYQYLIGGSVSSLEGAWDVRDIGIYVMRSLDATQPVYRAIGRASSLGGSTQLYDANQNWTVNQWAGYWLLANQNQTRVVKILSNDATSLTVGGDISELVVRGQAYVIFDSRQATRYDRLVRRVQEFVAEDRKVRVLFL